MGNAEYVKNIVGDLFFGSPDFLPTAFPDETLYSWCARYHRLNGGSSPRATSRQLFGHSTAGLRPDLPFHLANFQKITHQRLGSLDTVLRQRTVLGYYIPFLSPRDIGEISQFLASGSSIAARARLGISTSGQERPTVLQFCPECIREQLSTYSISWWKQEHLWPSVNICQRHHCLLNVARAELTNRVAVDYFLAHELSKSHLLIQPLPTACLRKLLSSIATWTSTLVNCADSSFDDSVLRFAYLVQAKERGWLTLDGSLRLKVLQDAFLAQCAELATVPSFQFVADADGVNGGFLGSLFRKYPGRRHPSKHIVLMNFMFPAPGEFFQVYETVRTVIAEDGFQGAQRLLTNSSHQLVHLIEQSGLSVSAAAERLDIPPGKALGHLKNRTDVKRNRRPHIVGTKREAKLREMLNEGLSRSEILVSLSIKSSFVTEYLAKDPVLREQWAAKCRQRLRDKQRMRFLSALQEHPGLSVREIRRLPMNGFQWLYKHDRVWLREILPAMWKS